MSSISMATYVEMPSWRAFRMSFLYHSRSCSRRCALFREKRWSCPALFSIQYRCSSLQSWLDRTDCQGWLQDSVR